MDYETFSCYLCHDREAVTVLTAFPPYETAGYTVPVCARCGHAYFMLEEEAAQGSLEAKDVIDALNQKLLVLKPPKRGSSEEGRYYINRERDALAYAGKKWVL